MAEILSADEIDALLSTVGCYDDIYIHKKNNKEYYFVQEVINKTNDTIMILYKDMNGIQYVRDKKDFNDKFIKQGDITMACGTKSKSKPKSKKPTKK